MAESGAADDEVARERLLALDDVARVRDDRGLTPLTVRRFPGAGHNLMRYRPAELTSAILELLDEASGSPAVVGRVAGLHGYERAAARRRDYAVR